MNKLKLFYVFFILLAVTKAQSMAQSNEEIEAEKVYKEEMSLEMCRSLEHRFEPSSQECSYCAYGLQYDPNTSQCVGTLDATKKCAEEDHYHAATQECMYCARNYILIEDSHVRECVAIQDREVTE